MACPRHGRRGAWLKLKRIRSLRDVASGRKRSAVLTVATCFSSNRERRGRGEKEERASRRRRPTIRRNINARARDVKTRSGISRVSSAVPRDSRVSRRDSPRPLGKGGSVAIVSLVPLALSEGATLGSYTIAAGKIAAGMRKENDRISGYNHCLLPLPAASVYAPDPISCHHHAAIQFARDAFVSSDRDAFDRRVAGGRFTNAGSYTSIRDKDANVATKFHWVVAD